MAILVPGHFAPARSHLPAATAAAAAATAAKSVPNPAGKPQGAQSTAPVGSQTQTTPVTTGQTSPVPRSRQPSMQNRRRRTEVMPDCIANARKKRASKRVSPESDSLNAPYVQLTPILDVDPNAMEVDEVRRLRSGKSQAADVINDPIIVRSHPSDMTMTLIIPVVLHLLPRHWNLHVDMSGYPMREPSLREPG